MKIWVIGRGYPTIDNRMWGIFELEQARLLARYGYEVSYIALTLSFFRRGDQRGCKIFQEEGIMVFVSSKLYFPGKTGLHWKAYEDKCWQELLDKAEERGKPDIIHVHYPSMITSIKEVDKYRKNGTRIFATEHWSRVLTNRLNRIEMERLKYYTTFSECFSTVGLSLQEAVKKMANVNAPMEVIPNIVSPVFFQKNPENDATEFTFVCIGRFLPVKQFDAIIRQYKKQFMDRKNVKLLIIGSGSEELKLVRESEGRVYFTGEIETEEVARYIAKSDALVSFSKYETFAVPVAEAWAAGKPIIVSNSSGIASYVNKELGIVVPSDSEEDLGKAMVSIYNNIDKYNSENIKAFAKNHFSDRAVGARIIEMYNRSN